MGLLLDLIFFVLQFQKLSKINFCTGKKLKNAKNAISKFKFCQNDIKIKKTPKICNFPWKLRILCLRVKFGHFGRDKSGWKNKNLSAKWMSNSATLAEFGHSWEHWLRDIGKQMLPSFRKCKHDESTFFTKFSKVEEFTVWKNEKFTVTQKKFVKLTL